MKRVAIGLAVLLAGWAAPAAAMTFMQVEHVCPIGGERFSAQEMGSGTAFGHFLDGRLHGAIQSPWPLVSCPGNGFVIYKDDYSADEIKRLTAVVESDEYQRMRGTETSYWLLARLFEAVDAPLKDRAGVLQSATWQASPQQYPRYVQAASAAVAQQCPDARAAADQDEPWLYCQMLLGEWERRLSRFDAARARFERLQPLPERLVLAQDRERARRQYVAEIAQQLQLIAENSAMNTMAVDANAPPAKEAAEGATARIAGTPGMSPEAAQAAADTAATAADASVEAAAYAADAAADAAYTGGITMDAAAAAAAAAEADAAAAAAAGAESTSTKR
ncbi:hypothetical protein [uncultured Stenotrophomonas sp.]|uniref:hypothetical protein n=1 Tax=uncultured Stenotrophomonas sp. TaxID=165438 RepID=UPI0025FA9B83|nr:hypothetical protein [uncultured Stenotrophomonas sp.]